MVKDSQIHLISGGDSDIRATTKTYCGKLLTDVSAGVAYRNRQHANCAQCATALEKIENMRQYKRG